MLGKGYRLMLLVEHAPTALIRILLLFVMVLAVGSADRATAITSDEPVDEAFTMSLGELSQVQVTMPATLLPTEQRLIPASVTVLTQEDIRSSGARNLDELLEMHVPGLQIMRKNQGNMVGVRGIISDRNNKLLLLVNGRSMNVKTRDGGAFAERHLSMLGDISRISIVRGPGSAVSGPGAIAGVISIETYNGLNFEGFSAQARAGALERFANAEVQYGRKLTEDLGLFVHLGVDDYQGADNSDGPLLFSHAFNAADGSAVVPGQPVPFEVVRENASHDRDLRMKAHLQVTGRHFDGWARYTRGGVSAAAQGVNYENVDPAELMNMGEGYQQLTVFTGYSRPLKQGLVMKGSFSFDTTDIVVHNEATDLHWREDEYLGRLLAQITPSDHHELAVGIEYAHEVFGKPGWFVKGPSVIFPTGIPAGTSWSSDLWSFFGEDQWQISDRWRTNLGLRLDKHTFTPWMFSPRAALIYTPNPRDTWKVIYNRSVRRSDDADLYRAEHLSGTEDKTETVGNLELRYERAAPSGWFWAASGYYNLLDVVSWDGVTQTINAIGMLETWGLEAEIQHRTPTLDLIFSHNFTQQIEFDLTRDTAFQNISAAPYGYGNNLANWHTHCTKLAARYLLTSALTATGSLRVYWGLPGGKDLADYNAEVVDAGGLPRYDSGHTNAFDESVYLNLGLEARPGRTITVALHGYHLLGLLDDNLNKHNFFQRTTQYRFTTPSVALSVRYAP